MYPAQFDYHRAESVSEALDLLAEFADEEAELLAGGHSLLPTVKSGLATPDVLIDIGRISDLDGIEVGEESVTFGALTSYTDVAASEEAWTNCTSFAEAAREIGDIQVRNAGTVGGNLAHNDPASDLPAAALVSDATIRAEGPDGEREIGIDEFFLATYTTTLSEDEILTSVEVPSLGEGDAGAYVKKASPSSGYAMVGVAVRLHTDGASIEDARVAVNGALTFAQRLEPVEEALSGESLDRDGLAADAASHATDDLEDWDFMDDIQASAEFRAHLLSVYAERAIDRALERVDEPVTAAP